MNFLNKMERKYGRYAIHNLTKYMIGCYAIGYILLYIGQAFGGNFFQYLLLSLIVAFIFSKKNLF